MAWSTDFMAVRLCEDRQFRLLNALNDVKRDEVGLYLPAERVTQSLDRIVEWRGKSGTIRVDNDHMNISTKLLEWAEKQGDLSTRPTLAEHLYRKPLRHRQA